MQLCKATPTDGDFHVVTECRIMCALEEANEKMHVFACGNRTLSGCLFIKLFCGCVTLAVNHVDGFKVLIET